MDHVARKPSGTRLSSHGLQLGTVVVAPMSSSYPSESSKEVVAGRFLGPCISPPRGSVVDDDVTLLEAQVTLAMDLQSKGPIKLRVVVGWYSCYFLFTVAIGIRNKIEIIQLQQGSLEMSSAQQPIRPRSSRSSCLMSHSFPANQQRHSHARLFHHQPQNPHNMHLLPPAQPPSRTNRH